ncbi:MAG: hypothetical protein GY904_11695 [Planctomycetaceae bacterium]|nr:hypothetical protein [Planctomycetaceae bacterium]
MTFQQRDICEFKDIHAGSDVWVIASGPSMNFVDPSFFTNKISVGVNRVNSKFDCDYIVAKDGRGFDELVKHRKRAKFILSKWESGNPGGKLNQIPNDHWIFDHPAKPNEKPDISVIGSEQIVVSHSTITSALHIAAFMGAENIIMCGHDCGAINGHNSMFDYYQEIAPQQGTDLAYFRWLSRIEDHTIQVRESLKSVYGVSIHSLNPFVNFNLEGNQFESATSLSGNGNFTTKVLQQQIQEVRERYEKLRTNHEALTQSTSYHIGRAMTSPLRYLRSAVTRGD